MHAALIIPTRDRPDLVDMAHATIARAGWSSADAVFVDNGTVDPAALRSLEVSPHRVIRAPMRFNFARLVNRGARCASADVVVLLNNDVEARDDGWLGRMMAAFDDPDVGIVGATLRYPSGRVQHAGIEIENGAPIHSFGGSTWGDLPGSIRDQVSEPLAVTAACMAVRADLWADLGGMSTPLATNYNDVDLCLRARRSGSRVALVPIPDLVHHESESRGSRSSPEVAADWLLFRSRWAGLLASTGRRRG